MKIYTIHIPDKYRPQEKLKYPKHHDDFGVEQDFYKFLKNNPKLTTSNPNEASWHYLPVFWTRWHVAHEYGKTGLIELRKHVSSKIISSKKTFTICQYADGPLINLSRTMVYLSSRNSSKGSDIPLLSKPHAKSIFKQKKKYIASFVGRIHTHATREKMRKEFEGEKNIIILDTDKLSTRKYSKIIQQSHSVLAPRGYGGGSFRFYEAMQLGVVPVLIGDIDNRPFKKQINWNDCSIYVRKPEEAKYILQRTRIDKLVMMGENASKVWEEKLNYQRWCNLLINELEQQNE